eukprot:TRINITY_DN18070_c0_g2_i1.p1 TRINITY_DN18070_c0_g2~~TRINITY_DN18070_c0_g2_i1.p1  ORF type:complete len:570 (+),score=127.74 TRINITY_DN18070_c0_g2_i1:31-1710(+)
MSASKRVAVLKELLDTEEGYVRHLRIIVGLYVVPLQSSDILEKNEITKIFSNVEEILNTNQTFLWELRQELGNGPEYSPDVQVGPVMLRLIPFFQSYTTFVNNQKRSNRTLTRLSKKHRRFKNFVLQQEEDDASDGLNLESHLITPIQRIPRYKLLLEQLIKYTEKSNPDYEPLEKALKQIESVANDINVAAREADDFSQLLELSRILTTNVKDFKLAIYGRRVVHKGFLVKVGRNSNRKYVFLLFNDIFIYAHTSATGAFVAHDVIPVNKNFKIEDLPDLPVPSAMGPDLIPEGYLFRMQILNSSKSFVVLATSQAEKDSWLKAYEKLVEQQEHDKKMQSEIISDQDQSPAGRADEDDAVAVWEPDYMSQECSVCNTKFTVLNRRHHCRKCGELVCGTCSSKKLAIKKSRSGKPVRVCNACISLMQTNKPKNLVSVSDQHEKDLVARSKIEKKLFGPAAAVVDSTGARSSAATERSSVVTVRSTQATAGGGNAAENKDSSAPASANNSDDEDFHYDSEEVDPVALSATELSKLDSTTSTSVSSASTSSKKLASHTRKV